MITYGGRFKQTLEVYHGIPKGWAEQDIIETHQLLGGTFDLIAQKHTEPGAPSWFPDRSNWLQYRKTLYLLSDGVLAGDAACVELCIRYLELRYIGSYSGFIRARFARRLKSAALTNPQKQRLNTLFTATIVNRDYTEEFTEYVKLWHQIISPFAIQAVKTFAKNNKGLIQHSWYVNLILKTNH